MPTQGNQRILIIDDNQLIHNDFRLILDPSYTEKDAASGRPISCPVPVVNAAQPYEVDSAFQGQEALEKVKDALEAGRPYALAFVDLRMPPGWDGVETTYQLWKIDPDLQVVFCTAHVDYDWNSVAERLGHPERFIILYKPFDGVEATQIANAFTEKWRLLKDAKSRLEDLERVVQERTDALSQAQKMEAIGHLSAGIAHEINTPMQFIGDNTRFAGEALAAISSTNALYEELVQALDADKPTQGILARIKEARDEVDLELFNEEAPRAIKQTLEGVQRVAKIINAMKIFSHPGEREKTAVSINEAIDSTLTVAQTEWKEIATLETDFASDLPPIECHACELNQAFLNVVVNAAHAMSEHPPASGLGKLTIKTSRVGDLIEIRISDTGGGIPEAIRPNIFDPFFTTKDVGKGTGQGLSLTHSIVVGKHQGQINFETATGVGTTFIIQLPITNQQPSDLPYAA